MKILDRKEQQKEKKNEKDKEKKKKKKRRKKKKLLSKILLDVARKIFLCIMNSEELTIGIFKNE